MTSLTEVYDGNEGATSSRRRVYAGAALLVAAAALAVVGLLVATTDLFAAAISGEFGDRKIAGLLGGLALPTALVAVFVGLPAGRRVQAAAAVSASLCLLGVALFWHAYPDHWAGYGQDLTLLVSVVYALGCFTAVWSLFTAVVNFKTRNDPGGALEMNVTRLGRTRIVEADDSGGDGGVGGVGFFGATPDGEVETQTNRSGGSRSEPGVGMGAASDGGSAAPEITSPLDGDGRDAEIVDPPSAPSEPTDRYCGNCRHFEYVRSSGGMTPYCARHDEAMDDMDACEEWTPNRS